MSLIGSLRIPGIALILILGSVTTLGIQKTNQAAATPVPPRSERALKVFISDVGSDDYENSGAGRTIPGEPERPFTEFFTAIQMSRRYTLVSYPAEADLVFEMFYVNPAEEVSSYVRVDTRDPGETDISKPPKQVDELVTSTVYHPRLGLVIRDRSTLAVQGVFTEPIRNAHTPMERDEQLLVAINALVDDANAQMGPRLPTSFVPSIAIPRVPPQITSGKKVFIANGGGPVLDGTPSAEQAYNEFYAMMKNWGGYELSSTVADADLVFVLSSGAYVRILDPRTGVILWGFRPYVHSAILKRNAQKNFDKAMVALVEKIARLAGKPAVTISVPHDLKDAPVPWQIGAAKTAYIANGGGESFPEGTGKTNQAYNDFYATMKKWGRYGLTPTATEADLVLQISHSGAQLRLAIFDAKSQLPLWKLNQHIRGAIGRPIYLSDFHNAIAALVKQTSRLVGQSLAKISVPAGINSAPIPSRISEARKVFISPPRGSRSRPKAIDDKENMDQMYSQIYAEMRSWGQYELTATPGEADLIFAPYVFDGPYREWAMLNIRDAKSHQVLWTFNQPAKIALLDSTAKNNFKDAIGLLMIEVRRVASRTPSNPKLAQKRFSKRNHPGGNRFAIYYAFGCAKIG
jgi:hypothetical protein